MFTQLNPLIPVLVVDRGEGFAFGVIDYSQEHHLMWVIAMDEGGDIWCVTNDQVRVQKNWSIGRTAGKVTPKSVDSEKPIM